MTLRSEWLALHDLNFSSAHASDYLDAEKPTCTLVKFQVGDWKRALESMTDEPIESGPKFS